MIITSGTRCAAALRHAPTNTPPPTHASTHDTQDPFAYDIFKQDGKEYMWVARPERRAWMPPCFWVELPQASALSQRVHHPQTSPPPPPHPKINPPRHNQDGRHRPPGVLRPLLRHLRPLRRLRRSVHPDGPAGAAPAQAARAAAARTGRESCCGGAGWVGLRARVGVVFLGWLVR